MNNAAVNNLKFIAVFLAEICLLALPSCRNDSTTGPGSQTGLSGPTVVIPVGVLKPQGIAVDAAGNIWVADTRQNRVRRFSPSGSATDSIVLKPSRIALDKRTGDLLAVENVTNISRILLQTKTVLATFVLNPFSGDATAVFDINSRASTPTRVEVRDIGDIDTSPAGDIYLAARGTPANTVIRILNGNISAVAASTTDSATTVARFLAVDGYGTVFTSFSIPRGPVSASIVYALMRPFVSGFSATCSRAVIESEFRWCGRTPCNRCGNSRPLSKVHAYAIAPGSHHLVVYAVVPTGEQRASLESQRRVAAICGKFRNGPGIPAVS
jgi:hypothetical protein